MQIVKSLFFVLLTYGLLSCAPQKAAPTTSGLGKTSQCGEILVGVTTEKQELELAGATLKEFSLGRLDIRVTPEFQRIASEAAMNEDSKIKVACKAIEMAGVEGDSEMVAYFIQMQSFLSMNPSVDDRIKWRQAFPHPKAAPQRQSRPTHTGFGDSVEIELDPSLARSCKQPTVGLRRQPEYFVSIWYHFLRQLKAEKFPQDRDLNSLYHIKGRYRDPYNNPEDLFSESLYTLKCLEDVGEIKLEMLGTTGKYGGKVFENQRIDFGEPSIANSNEWRRLTDSDKAQLSLILSNGSRYQIEIFRIATPDSIRLTTDFYNLFTQLGWTVPHKPQTPEYDPEPGIRVMSIQDNIPSAPIKNMKERSGALLLTEALEKIKLPVMYEARGGMIADLTIHLEIGMKPEKH
jgi:hypothetical protein